MVSCALAVSSMPQIMAAQILAFLNINNSCCIKYIS
jgi:hypothetical protein